MQTRIGNRAGLLLLSVDDYRRKHEQRNALWLSGCRYYPEINSCADLRCWSYEEAVNVYGFETFESFQVEMIRKYRPYVVVGHSENGEYGHGAHYLASRALEQAVLDASQSERFPDSVERYGVWDTPKCYIHLYGDDPTVLDDTLPLEAFGGKTIYQVATECYQQHASQYQMGYYKVYSKGHPTDARLFGLQRTLVGEDIAKNDLFENIDLETGKDGIMTQ